MSEELVTILILAALGILLVLFPKPIAAFYCRYMRELCLPGRNAMLAKALEGVVWVVERVSLGTVYDEATAPKAFQFVGFCSLATTLVHVLLLLSRFAALGREQPFQFVSMAASPATAPGQ